MPQAPREKGPPDDRGFPSKPAKSGKTSGASLPNAARKQGLGLPARPLRWAPFARLPAPPALSDGCPLPKPPAPPVPHSSHSRRPQTANARQNRSFAKRAPPRRRPAPAIAASRTNAQAGRARVRRKDGRQGRPPASETSPRSGSAPCDRLPRRPRTPPRQPRAASRRRTYGVRPRARRRRAPPR